MAAALACLLACGLPRVPSVLRLRGGASETQRHYHDGKLTPYVIGEPSLLLSSSDEARLRSGRPVMQAITADDGLARRMIMVQDIRAPHTVVMGRIMDFAQYPRMVSGVDSCVTYASNDEKGLRTVKSTYEISALHMKFKYFIKHEYDPAARCMTFRLDYDRRSDIDDSVGYWYVAPTGRTTCRVFYSCECKLRGWVPGPVYSMLTKEALKKATVWVERESVKEWRDSRSGFANQALVQFAANVRQSVAGLKLPGGRDFQPADWLASRREAAVRFVSAMRPPPCTQLAEPEV